jgi:uncharacterized phosphosugar-binding protein
LCYAGEVSSRDEVAQKASALADSVLDVAAKSNDPALQRSAAEMFAFAACIASTPFAAALVRTLVQAMAECSSAPRCTPPPLMSRSHDRTFSVLRAL